MTPIAPPPMAEMQSLIALLDSVSDAKKQKARLEELAAVTGELHDALRKQAEVQADITAKLEALNEKEVAIGQREAVCQQREANLNAAYEEMEQKKAALRALVG